MAWCVNECDERSDSVVIGTDIDIRTAGGMLSDNSVTINIHAEGANSLCDATSLSASDRLERPAQLVEKCGLSMVHVTHDGDHRRTPRQVLLGGEATSFGQNIRMRDWLRDVYPAPEVQAAIGAAGMSECTQRAGETVFVPAGWHHAVLNLGEVISLAVQKSGPGGAFEGQAAAAAGAGASSEAEVERGG